MLQKIEGEVFVPLYAFQGDLEPSRGTILPQSPCSLIPGLVDRTPNPLGFSVLWSEPRMGHKWESQVLLMDGQVAFPQVLLISPTFD